VAWAGPTFTAGKNFVINGNFDIWQRGTSFTSTSSIYTADRWQVGGNYTVTRQTTGVPIGSQYCLRGVNTASSYAAAYSYLETSQSFPLQGQTVTISAKFRRNATASFGLKLSVSKSSTVDAGYGSTFTEIGSETVSNANLPTGTGASNWYTAKATFTIPSDGTANGLRIGIEPTITDVNGAYWEAAQVQLELGSVPTTFSRAGGTLQGELAACQRYLPAVFVSTETFGFAYSTTGTQFYGTFGVTPRVAPTGLTISSLSDFTVYSQNFSSGTPTAIVRNTASTSTYSFTVTTTAGSPTLVTGQPAKLQITGANGYALFTGCEL